MSENIKIIEIFRDSIKVYEKVRDMHILRNAYLFDFLFCYIDMDFRLKKFVISFIAAYVMLKR